MPTQKTVTAAFVRSPPKHEVSVLKQTDMLTKPNSQTVRVPYVGAANTPKVFRIIPFVSTV